MEEKPEGIISLSGSIIGLAELIRNWECESD
jgi:hypothetical protein